MGSDYLSKTGGIESHSILLEEIYFEGVKEPLYNYLGIFQRDGSAIYVDTSSFSPQVTTRKGTQVLIRCKGLVEHDMGMGKRRLPKREKGDSSVDLSRVLYQYREGTL